MANGGNDAGSVLVKLSLTSKGGGGVSGIVGRSSWHPEKNPRATNSDQPRNFGTNLEGFSAIS